MKKILIIISLSLLLINLGNQSFAQSDDKLVILHTNLGNIVIELFPNDAPNHVQNFIKLAEDGFYDGTIFHRIIPGFMIQGGDPNTKGGDQNTWGTGGPGYSVNAEFNTIKHNRGIVSMARSIHVDSAGSQFFIVLSDKPNQPNIEDWNNLDELYTVFGRIVTQESFDTIDKIASVETKTKDIPVDIEQVKITKVEIVDRSKVLNLLELNDPERIIHIIETPDYIDYENKKLGVAFSIPISWFVQDQQNPNEPLLTITGQKLGLIPPIINIIMEEKGQKSFEQKINEYDNFLQDGVNSNQIEILSKEMIDFNGLQAYAVDRLQDIRTQNLIFTGEIKQIIFPTDEKYITLTYYNDQKYFNQQYHIFEKFSNTFKIISEQANITSQNEKEGGACLIATAAYGSELAPQIQQLREIRDNTILPTQSGTTFMIGFNQFYYSFSPIVADWERESPVFKEIVKLIITPMLSTLSIMTLADSEAEVLGLGISVIALNFGMYFVAPIIIIHKIRKKF
ncbi:peptidylprolyl isomerase [Nitrosarchaeum sp. AC2]|uniref:peptidylprolyl isomerase n=1 Tax=Nitrosarchaeum sp. AC2 TaxID=2259673 RepID=UPI0015C7ABBB|nr:peptidylprolyl isomerase [Nitrosarchaeum sp. AC2]QLH10080.1 peptidylprolyl isomerase [Nitrosarchaeum sp. AC2]